MNKSAWEIVDEPMRPQPQSQPLTAQQLLPVFFGRWWKWKAAILILLASIILIVFATFAGIVVLLLACIALLSLSMKKITRWLRGGSATPGQQVL